MTESELKELYFKWLCSLVCYGASSRRGSTYRTLLRKLFRTSFYYKNSEDYNRYFDGTELRYRFGYENAYEEAMIATLLDSTDCSILEMMVALAVRCEEDIMSDSRYGNRTDIWFWSMVSSLGLMNETNDFYDDGRVNGILEDFLELRYDKTGRGGLFTVPGIGDLRNKDIWYQMNQFLHYVNGVNFEC